MGVGIGSTAVAYGSLWSRNANPTAITTGEGLPNVRPDDIRQPSNLAATTSSFQGILSDKLVSQQVLRDDRLQSEAFVQLTHQNQAGVGGDARPLLVGVNYALTEGLSVGVKGRWVHGAAFESDDALVAATTGIRCVVTFPICAAMGASEPVSGQLLTDASTLWDVGLSLTYHF